MGKRYTFVINLVNINTDKNNNVTVSQQLKRYGSGIYVHKVKTTGILKDKIRKDKLMRPKFIH